MRRSALPMSYGHTQQAKGFSEYPNAGTVKMAVTMPREHFIYMRKKALKNGWSISEVIREYINIGIIVDKEMEEDWPKPAKLDPICVVDISRAPGLRKALSEPETGA